LPKEERRRAVIGSAEMLPIADGQLKAATCVIYHQGSSIRPAQEGPHPHVIRPSVDGRFALVTDLGIDQVLIYQLDTSTGQLALNRQGRAVVSESPGAPAPFRARCKRSHVVCHQRAQRNRDGVRLHAGAQRAPRARSSRRYRMALMDRRSGTHTPTSPSRPTANSSTARIEGMTASPCGRSRTRMARCGQLSTSRRGGRHRTTSPSIRLAPGCSSRIRTPTPSTRFVVIRAPAASRPRDR
jgi:hypothetical protein